MYKMIGGDGREYGPVAAEQLRAWIREGRVNSQTLLQVAGSEAWQPLSTYPEFQEVTVAQPESALDVEPDEPLSETGHHDEWEGTRGRGLSVIRCVASGGDLLRRNFGLLCGASLLVWLVQMVLISIPILGGLLNLAFYGVLYGGLFRVFLRRLRGHPARVADALGGFNSTFAQLVLVGLFTQVLSAFGLFFLALPGVYLIVAWSFALPLVADRGLEFWSAMEISRKTVNRCWFRVAAVSVFAFLPVLAVLFYNYYRTVRETLAVVAGGALTVDRLQQVIEAANSRALLQQIVLLFALPLGTGMMLQAYEDLFGDPEAEKQEAP